MKTLLSLFTALMLSISALAEVVIVNGIYQGKDLYIKNPVTSSGIGFCIFEVVVNGNISSDEVNSPAFAIDLAVWKFKQGDPIEIVLRCKESCDVKIINPEAVYPTSTYEITDIKVEPNGLLTWETKNETAVLPYVIEQFKWNRWMKVGETNGTGNKADNHYAFQTNLTSGTNTFRIYQLDHKGQRLSTEITVESATPQVSLKGNKISEVLEFSAETDYEVYSEYGTLIKAGRGQKVDTSKFYKGKYYVSYDNKGGVVVEKNK
jgi:hypothetical protein